MTASDTESAVQPGHSHWLRKGASLFTAAITGRPVLTRSLLAGPGALLVAFAFLAGMPIWLPAGPAGVDNIVFPLVLAPLFWAVAFTYACIDENLARATAVMSVVLLVNALLIASALAG